MILFSENIRNLISNNDIRIFYLIRIANTTTEYKKITSHYGNILLEGDSTPYIADGSLIGVSPPKVSTNVDRQQFKIDIADPAFVEASAVDSGLVGYGITIRMGFLDPTGLPYTNLIDSIITYSGRVDSVGYLVKTEQQGESTLQISGASPMADLDLKKFIYLSRDFIRARDPNDTCCDMIFGGSGTLQLKWGKS